MLKKKERLSRKEFNRFFSSGERIHSLALMVVYVQLDTFHASAVATKKIFATAVLRNKFRRRVYDILRRYGAEHNLKGVFIVIAKTPARTIEYSDIKKEIIEVIRKRVRIG